MTTLDITPNQLRVMANEMEKTHNAQMEHFKECPDYEIAIGQEAIGGEKIKFMWKPKNGQPTMEELQPKSWVVKEN